MCLRVTRVCSPKAKPILAYKKIMKKPAGDLVTFYREAPLGMGPKPRSQSTRGLTKPSVGDILTRGYIHAFRKPPKLGPTYFNTHQVWQISGIPVAIGRFDVSRTSNSVVFRSIRYIKLVSEVSVESLKLSPLKI